ncbi:aminotransferase class IV [Burkholderia metallica]
MAIIQVQQIMHENPLHARAPHEPRYEDGSAFCNGNYVPVTEATVPLVDAGFLHADAAYDVVTVSRGNFFRLDDHLTRMEASAAKFFLENPFNRDQVKEILHTLVRNAGLKDAYVWWCVTRGPLSVDRRDRSAMKNAMFAFAVPFFFQADDEVRTRGSNLLISKRYNRISAKAVDPTAKNFHWMDMKLALFEAMTQQKDWAVLVDEHDNLTEAAGANVFFVKNGELHTPAEGCLLGITRQSVFDIAVELGIKVNIGTYTATQLRDADEAFTSSSAGGIMPVSAVDDQPLGNRNGPGPISEKIHNLYWEKRWAGWHARPVEYFSSVPA